ncbi:hypothetical protein BX600DRAFT_444284 [Xylariales sp. PMI_506]|nr:hypothetical protein BX600DRAFT_444284 [Xylariales sp. PMI_506]
MRFLSTLVALQSLACSLGAQAKPVEGKQVLAREVEQTQQQKRDSHGCYGFDANSFVAKSDALSGITAACNNLGSRTIAIGTYVDTTVSLSGGKYIYVQFLSNELGGWFINPSFCIGELTQLLNQCPQSFDGVSGTNGGAAVLDNQGHIDFDTGPD